MAEKEAAERLMSNVWETYIDLNPGERDWPSIADTILGDGRIVATDYLSLLAERDRLASEVERLRGAVAVETERCAAIADRCAHERRVNSEYRVGLTEAENFTIQNLRAKESEAWRIAREIRGQHLEPIPEELLRGQKWTQEPPLTPEVSGG